MTGEITAWRPAGWKGLGAIQDYYESRAMNAANPYQGVHKKVLCVCSAGLLRSPTAALVLSQPPYNFNTRAAGVGEQFALVVIDQVLLLWADEIVCMTSDHEKRIRELLTEHGLKKPVTCLHISDEYAYRDPELMRLIRVKYDAA